MPKDSIVKLREIRPGFLVALVLKDGHRFVQSNPRTGPTVDNYLAPKPQDNIDDAPSDDSVVGYTIHSDARGIYLTRRGSPSNRPERLSEKCFVDFDAVYDAPVVIAGSPRTR